MQPLIVGTRGSALALVQAEMAEAALHSAFPHRPIIRKIIKTTGDIRTDVPLFRVTQTEGVLDKGVFTRELEVALENGDVDIAVHSLKDVPTVLADHFDLAGVLERAPSGDVLISTHPGGMNGLPEGAIIATSSVRRQRQLKWLRPDIQLVDIRGNVSTRLQKLMASDIMVATMLAKAGLLRLGYDLSAKIEGKLHACTLAPEVFLPAAGQGIIGFEIRRHDTDARDCVRAITHSPSMVQARAEREFLRLLDAGCHTPVGVKSWINGGTLSMACRVFDEENDALPPSEALAGGLVDDPESLANELFQSIK